MPGCNATVLAYQVQNNETTECVSVCPEDSPFLDAGYCRKQCSSGLFQSDGTSRVCVEECRTSHRVRLDGGVQCVDACPMHLMPTELEHARERGDIESLKKHHVLLCIECGSCAFVCPAKRNLVESHKLAKAMVREAKK